MCPGRPVSIVLAGIGGMGAVYLRALLDRRDEGIYQLVAAADPFPERCPYLEELAALGIPVFLDLGEFYKKRGADLAIISSPIHVHAAQTCLALENGSHVLCEKPAAATVGEVRRMIEARDKAGRQVAIGYQWSFSAAVQNLKKDVRDGMYGGPKRLRCLYLWPRNEAYYARNDWAGKIRHSGGGWVLDGPANNAMAHDLHNMFYILGSEVNQSARPAEVTAELYKAYDIENCDTAAALGRLDNDAEIHFWVSHASLVDKGPVMRYEFEKGDVFLTGRQSDLRGRLKDGRILNYGSPDLEPMKKLWDTIDAARTGRSVVCGIDAAMSQTIFIGGLQASMSPPVPFPRPLVRTENKEGGGRRWVEGLDDVLERCYETGELPSGLGVLWARKGKTIDLLRPPDLPDIRA